MAQAAPQPFRREMVSYRVEFDTRRRDSLPTGRRDKFIQPHDAATRCRISIRRKRLVEMKTETTKTEKANTESGILLRRTIVISVMDVGREDEGTDYC